MKMKLWVFIALPGRVSPPNSLLFYRTARVLSLLFLSVCYTRVMSTSTSPLLKSLLSALMVDQKKDNPQEAPFLLPSGIYTVRVPFGSAPLRFQEVTLTVRSYAESKEIQNEVIDTETLTVDDKGITFELSLDSKPFVSVNLFLTPSFWADNGALYGYHAQVSAHANSFTLSPQDVSDLRPAESPYGKPFLAGNDSHNARLLREQILFSLYPALYDYLYA